MRFKLAWSATILIQQDITIFDFSAPH